MLKLKELILDGLMNGRWTFEVKPCKDCDVFIPLHWSLVQEAWTDFDEISLTDTELEELGVYQLWGNGVCVLILEDWPY